MIIYVYYQYENVLIIGQVNTNNMWNNLWYIYSDYHKL